MLKDKGVKPRENLLWNLGVNLSDLPKGDILHTFILGHLVYLLDWNYEFIKSIGALVMFNKVWLSVPPNNVLTQPTKSYEEVSRS